MQNMADNGVLGASGALMEATVAGVHAAMLAGTITCRDLVDWYLRRIKAYDAQGPRLNSIILVNPKAAGEAERLDAEFRKTGTLTGPLHGIPVLLKDNFDTADMPTTAGSLSLAGFTPPDDAFVTARLRRAGAIILAKTNLHEFAIWGETVSSVLGQTLNPYDLTRTPGGSSGGTGAGIAANFGIIGMGTDTINSIRSPASANSLVGIRPTIGLVSRDGIVPYSLTQDTAGPICRTVEDAVRALDVIAGYDSADAETAWGAGMAPASYTAFLKTDGMKGRRIGVLESFFGTGETHAEVNRVVREAIAVFSRNGAELLSITEPIDSGWLTSAVSVHLDDLKDHLNGYLRALPPDAPVHSLEEVMASGKYHPGIKANMETALARSTGTPEYNAKLALRAETRTRVMKLLADYRLDAIVYPHQQQLVCKAGESQQQRNGVLCSVTGFPSIAVPAGFSAPGPDAPLGVPVGLEIIGRPWSEPVLIAIAYGFEQATLFRKSPLSTPALDSALP
jgi:Asp-tRNA(Asn)/Glu-tRNA(Gln) amidotransferase A subunit family amidase